MQTIHNSRSSITTITVLGAFASSTILSVKISGMTPTKEKEDEIKKWNIKADKVMYVLSISIKDEFLHRIKDLETPKEAWDVLATLFVRTNDAQFRRLENELLSISRRELSISQYFTKIKSLCEEITKLDTKDPISDTKIRRIIFHGLKPEFNDLIIATRGWATQPILTELENILANQVALDKQMSVVSLKEEKALFCNKRGSFQKRSAASSSKDDGDKSKRKPGSS